MPGTPPPPPPPCFRQDSSLVSAHSPAWTRGKLQTKRERNVTGTGERLAEEGVSLATPLVDVPTPPSQTLQFFQELHHNLLVPHIRQQGAPSSLRQPPHLPASKVLPIRHPHLTTPLAMGACPTTAYWQVVRTWTGGG